MAKATHARYGDPTNNVVQAAGLFATHMQRNSTMNRLTGPMPKGTAGVESTLRKQTTAHMPIVKCQDLSKGTGDEVKFHLLNPVNAKPIMGSNMAEGRGTGMSIAEDKLRVDQARFPVDMGNVMTSIRSPVDFRALGRPVAQNLMDRYVDQTLLVHMAGARGFQDSDEWVVPKNTDPNFDAIMVNKVKAPTKNRHFIVNGDSITGVTDNSGELAIATDDALTMDTVDSMKSAMDVMAMPPPIVKMPGDIMADDAPLRVWLMSPTQFNSFAADPAFRQYQAAALSRANQASKHPLFMGEAGIWNGFLIIKMPRPIRFYAKDEIRYCPDKYSETESGLKVPESFGKDFAVDRSLILGGQAVAEALAASEKSKIPFFWSEKELDHGDKVELLIGTIRGTSKIRFARKDSNGKEEITDNGIIAIDSVVKVVEI